jgi:hypothetical protein
MGKKLDPIENAGFQQTCLSWRGTTLTPRCNVVLRPVQADFRELPVHPATTSESKQFEFFGLTGSADGLLTAQAQYSRNRETSA